MQIQITERNVDQKLSMIRSFLVGNGGGSLDVKIVEQYKKSDPKNDNIRTKKDLDYYKQHPVFITDEDPLVFQKKIRNEWARDWDR